ncbi:MAG: selenocysteine-specific translation elongation factor [Gaiellales bacterium]
MTRHLTLGTAGHVDHGKTTLVRTLTGTDTDRLEEEHRRGISIVLGFAELALSDELQLSVVDVPGHERFVRTMVGGATGIDLALVCVAADDGVMPQTTEHLAILGLLGVRHAVVALTKTDLVDDARRATAIDGVRAALAATPFPDAPIVPVAAPTGEGLDELLAALRVAAAATPSRGEGGRARLPVDRSFTLHGIGTVITGTLWSGTLTAGATVTVEPSGREVRVRSLQIHGEDAERASAGSRVAAALVGIERADVPPGTVLWTGLPAAPSYRLDVELSLLEGAEAPRRGEPIEVLHGTTIAHAKAVPLGDTELLQLRLTEPLAALRGDRVVLRRLAPPGTIAGATILDPRPRRHAGGQADVTRLRTFATGDADAIVAAMLREGAVRAADAATRGLLEPDAAGAALAAAPDTLVFGDWHVARSRYDAIRRAIESRLSTRAIEHPLDPSVPMAALLKETPWREALLEQLVADGVLERDGSGLRLAGTGASEDELAVADALLARLAAEPFATHRQTELVEQLPLPSDDAWAVLAQLDRNGRIARLPDGIAVGGAAYADAVRIVRELCAANGEVTLAQVRDATGSSRKVVQALLERMDADGITRRTGDTRVLRRSAASGG